MPSRRPGEDPRRRPLLDDLAVVHDHDALAEVAHVFPRFIDNRTVFAVIGEGRHRRSHLHDVVTGERTRLFHNNTVRDRVLITYELPFNEADYARVIPLGNDKELKVDKNMEITWPTARALGCFIA